MYMQAPAVGLAAQTEMGGLQRGGLCMRPCLWALISAMCSVHLAPFHASCSKHSACINVECSDYWVIYAVDKSNRSSKAYVLLVDIWAQ